MRQSYKFTHSTADRWGMFDPRSGENSLAREVFAADQSIQGYIPDIRRNKKEWFAYFDHNKTNKLSKAALLQALVDTLMTTLDYNTSSEYSGSGSVSGSGSGSGSGRGSGSDRGCSEQQREAPDIDALISMIDAMWEVTGLQPNDLVSLDEFIAPDGVADTVIASLPPLPRVQQSSPSAPVSVSSSFLPTNPMMEYLQMQCGLCGAQKSIAYTPTTIPTNMMVTCSVCACRNEIALPILESTQQGVSGQTYPMLSEPVYTTTRIGRRDNAEDTSSSSSSSSSSSPSLSSSSSSSSSPSLSSSSTVFKNVFVLCPGRCGSQTFSTACKHLTNYTSGAIHMQH